jgi:hypothetical protein
MLRNLPAMLMKVKQNYVLWIQFLTRFQISGSLCSCCNATELQQPHYKGEIGRFEYKFENADDSFVVCLSGLILYFCTS